MKARLRDIFSDRVAIAERMRRRSTGVIAAVLLTLAAAVAAIVSLSGAANVAEVQVEGQPKLAIKR